MNNDQFRITFGKMRAENLLCFKHVEIDFRDFSKLNLITGINNDIPNTRNGSGKSSLPNLLVFALYGRTISQVSMANIINRLGKGKLAEVELQFTVNTNEYKIFRGFNEKYNSHYFTLHENGNNITKSTMKETQKYLESQILHLKYSAFMRTVVLTLENNENFFILSKQQKKLFIEETFGLEPFGKMFTAARKNNIDLEKRVGAAETALATLSTTITDLTKSHSEFADVQRVKITDISTQIFNAVKAIKHLLEQPEEEALDIARLVRIQENIAKLEALSTQTTTTITNLSIELGSIKERARLKAAQLQKYGKILECVCNNCKTNLVTILKLDSIEDNCESDLEAKQTSIKKLQDAVDQIHSRLGIEQQKQNRIVALQDNLARLQSAINEEATKTNPFESLIERKTSELNSIKSEVSDLNEKRSYMKFMEYISSEEGLKKYIVEDLVGSWNNLIKLYLARLGANYTCVFDSNMDFSFVTDTGAAEFGNFSSGEKSRINIATLFSLKDLLIDANVVSTNVLFIDEYFDSSLDDFATINILKILNEQAIKYNQAIFIVSHKEFITQQTYNKQLQFTKTNGISTLAITTGDYQKD